MKEMKPIVVAIVAVVFAGAGFFGGMTYQKTKQPTLKMGNFGTNVGNGNMMNRNGVNTGTTGQGTQRRMMGGMVIGEIISIDGNSMTIKTMDGGSKIVVMNSDTQYRKSSEASSTELKQGDTVNVAGTSNSDGSVTATSVQLNPEFKFAPSPIPEQ